MSDFEEEIDDVTNRVDYGRVREHTEMERERKRKARVLRKLIEKKGLEKELNKLPPREQAIARSQDLPTDLQGLVDQFRRPKPRPTSDNIMERLPLPDEMLVKIQANLEPKDWDLRFLKRIYDRGDYLWNYFLKEIGEDDGDWIIEKFRYWDQER